MGFISTKKVPKLLGRKQALKQRPTLLRAEVAFLILSFLSFMKSFVLVLSSLGSFEQISVSVFSKNFCLVVLFLSLWQEGQERTVAKELSHQKGEGSPCVQADCSYKKSWPRPVCCNCCSVQRVTLLTPERAAVEHRPRRDGRSYNPGISGSEWDTSSSGEEWDSPQAKCLDIVHHF